MGFGFPVSWHFILPSLFSFLCFSFSPLFGTLHLFPVFVSLVYLLLFTYFITLTILLLLALSSQITIILSLNWVIDVPSWDFVWHYPMYLMLCLHNVLTSCYLLFDFFSSALLKKSWTGPKHYCFPLTNVQNWMTPSWSSSKFWHQSQWDIKRGLSILSRVVAKLWPRHNGQGRPVRFFQLNLWASPHETLDLLPFRTGNRFWFWVASIKALVHLKVSLWCQLRKWGPLKTLSTTNQRWHMRLSCKLTSWAMKAKNSGSA